MSALGVLLRLDQKWAMFSPRPPNDHGWWVIEGELDDGTPVDVLRHSTGPASREKPRLVSATFPSVRWRKYMEYMLRVRREAYWKAMTGHFCRTWKGNRTGRRRLATLSVTFMHERTPPPGQPAPRVEPSELGRWRCERDRVENLDSFTYLSRTVGGMCAP